MPMRNLIWAVVIMASAALLVLLIPSSSRWEMNPHTDPVADAYARIRSNYLFDIDEDMLRQQAIQSMVQQLDKYSIYLPPDKARPFSERMEGTTWGLGLRVLSTKGRVEIVGVDEGSPAIDLPLKSGDRLLEVDGKEVSSLDLSNIEALLDSPTTDETQLTVMHADGKWEVIQARRARYRVNSVQGLYRDETRQWVHLVDQTNGVGYVRITEILPETPSQLRAVLRRLDGPRALVLDLRDNPGGGLPQAAEISDLFITEGVIATIISKGGRTEVMHAREPETYPTDVPVVVLVNHDTASAAEFIAGSLKEAQRAALVGKTTRGKSCIQSMIPLPGGLGQINLTTSRFVLRQISQGVDDIAHQPPIQPHVEVAPDPYSSENLRQYRLRVESLPLGRVNPSTDTRSANDDSPHQTLIQLDPQLKRAMQLAASQQEINKILHPPKPTTMGDDNTNNQ